MIRAPFFAGAATLPVVLGSATAARAASWAVDVSRSKLGFSGQQTGAPFTGRFKTWTASIDFDPARPEAAHVVATVDVATATTGDPQKDEAMPSADWFDASDFAKARSRIYYEPEAARRPGERARVDALASLVETGGCRRAVLLRHFGETPPEQLEAHIRGG